MPQSCSERLAFDASVRPAAGGIRFGCARAMVTARRRDRREGLAHLFAVLTRALDRHGDVSLMRGAFEQAVRRLVPVRTIRLREAGSRWSGPAESSAGAESVAFDVPGLDPATKGVLEATFDPAYRLGEWDFQMLGLAAQIGGLVLELESVRLQLARGSGADASRPRRDSSSRAVALVGLTAPMQALRACIDRVAATDFTVLLDGGSCAQLESQFRP